MALTQQRRYLSLTRNSFTTFYGEYYCELQGIYL